MRLSILLGLAMFTSAALLGCDDESPSDDQADGTGGEQGTECPTVEPAAGDACNWSQGCTFAGCPAGQEGDGFRQYECKDGVVGQPYVDMNCRTGSGSTGAGGSGE